MGDTTDNHALWVNLSSLGDGNIFAVLPQLMQQMLGAELINNIEEFSDVILPSDETWQTKIYYQLVEKQRQAGYIDNDDDTMFDPLSVEERPKLHEWNTLPKPKIAECDPKLDKNRRKRKVIKATVAITWTVSDLAKAGCLLSSPPLSAIFEDEQEMRRVYTLVYDVFRYKNVLTQALNDISFFQTFPKLSSNMAVVWLLFYDLYHRSFNKRETSIAPLANQLFDAYGLSFPENALWTQKVKLAAAVARLRIKNNALSLSEMLPSHLKDEKVTEQAQSNPVTCWINVHKIKDGDKLCQDIERSFGLRLVLDISQVNPHTFKWDKHCPQTIVFHSSMRSRLAKSQFVKNHSIIVQDKSFCLGPATFKKVLTDLELTGSVIQTHVNSPRTVAYLATLLSQNEKIKKLLAFSAGKRKEEYENYFNQLGMSNIKLFSDRLIDTPPDANYMEEVVAVFATPPNSYSAVVDPIDLVCSRGGDLSMLEILTETADTKEARERVASVLEEQQRTLRFAMSRPQIQFVLYETHSELDAENCCMVTKTVKEINKIAKLQHAALQGKQLCAPHPSEAGLDTKEINNNTEKIGDGEVNSKLTLLSDMSDEQVEEKILEGIVVPDTDLFDTPALPTLCDSETCRSFDCGGCYLALLQRKEIIRLDDKYMIQMAEHRGLFGSHQNGMNVKSKAPRVIRKRIEKAENKGNFQKKLRDSEIGRIAQPTQTFLRHTKSISELATCPKNHSNTSQTNVYKNWWKETSRHINCLKRSLVRQKIIPPNPNYSNYSGTKAVIGGFQRNKSYTSIDEVVKEKNRDSKIPVYPRLKLKRSRIFEKSRVPVDYEDIFDENNFDYECATQTRNKFIFQPVKVYKFSESKSELILHQRDPVVAKPIPQPQDKFTQCGLVARFSLARLQRHINKNVPEIEVFNSTQSKQDVSILTQPEPPAKHILSKLSSAHIRQFVCPFYKQLDTSPNLSGPPITEIFKSDLKEQSERFESLITKSKCDFAQTEPKFTKRKIIFPKIDAPVVQYEIRHPANPPRKMKKVDRLIHRLTTPTHSSRAKRNPKKDGKTDLSPIQEPLPHCQHCRLNQLKFEKKDPNYDELQEFLDNIYPPIID